MAETITESAGDELAASAAAATGVVRREIAEENATLAESGSLEGERKTVTALFADIKGSTELEQDLDPEEARALVDPALKLMIDAVGRYDGYIVQSTGDGIFAIFGAPVAHEDHPQRALYAALRMQEDLRRYSDKLLADGRAPLEIRVGANTGEVVVRSISTGGGNVEYTPIGHTTNLASRMQALAPTGSVAISEQTRRLVEGYFALKPRGPTKIKGVTEPVNVYEVTGLGLLRTRLQRGAVRGLTKFVGREREMEALGHAAEQAKAGRGQIVAAMAEAGAGKSRLFFEFKAKNQSGWMVLEAFSVSHGKASAYLPVLDLLHAYFKIVSDDDARARREKVTGRVLALDRTLEDALPYLFALLGIVEAEDPIAQMAAQVRKRRTLDAIKRILLHESLNQPLIVMFEDLHWIDEQTQALLNLLADSIATAKVLLLVNYRPEYSHQWNRKTYYTQLRLDPLEKESADEMLSALLGDAPELAPLKRLVLERTQGNPLFVEELVNALFDEGVLVRNGAVKITRSLSQLKIPPTVQGILAARIDRLPPEAKELLQTLAVIGMEFSLVLARAVVLQPAERLDSLLSELQTGEFIYEQPVAGDIEYTFKHALTHDVAYNSLLQERRRVLHEQIGAAIEVLFADRLDDHLRRLADHYGRSANTTKAALYLEQAAKRAVAQSAFGEASAYLDRGRELLERLPTGNERDQFGLRVLEMRAQMLAEVRGMAGSELKPALEAVSEAARKVRDRGAEFSALVRLRIWYGWRSDYSKSLEVCDQLLTVAGSNPRGAAWADFSAADTLNLIGDFEGAKTRAERAFAAATRVSDPSLLRLAQEEIAWCDSNLGFADQARSLAREAIARFRSSGSIYDLAHHLAFSCVVGVMVRDASAVLTRSQEAAAIASERGFALPLAWAQFHWGWALGWTGQLEQGIAQMQRGVEEMEATGVPVKTWAIVPLAEVLARADKTKEAAVAVEQALKRVKEARERLYEPDALRLRSELLVRDNAIGREEAELGLREAIRVAQELKAKPQELRAIMSLARLLRDTGRRDEAHTMLAEIYNWFTEGFDTADLKDAKALLEQLTA